MSKPNEPESSGVSPEEAADPELARLQDGIEQTRAEMSATISTLETRLSPSEVRQTVDHVEDRVKAIVQAELTEAKNLLRTEMNEAEDKIKKGLGQAREAVKNDLKEAMNGAKRAVRAATLGKVEDLATNIGDKMNDTRDTLVDTIRNNPIPAALTGIGLAWLLMNRSSSASGRAGRSQFDRQNGFGDLADGFGDSVGNARAAVGNAAHRATDAASRGLHRATDAVGGAAHGASEAAMDIVHRAGSAASHLAEQASDAASSVAEGASRGARRVEQGFQTTLQDNPLAVGAAAIALGAVVGFSLPRTQREDALMGEARDRVLELAGEAAHDAAASVGQLAEKTVETAKKSAQQSGGA